ncbi:hypothetical protein [Jidongwangia harbinensis]|uniref:hypothetical protein n=1 Tax=Jidongwangia harbinensis TaxID=2878561 RepID=UPI001CD949C3|nr:hypothetical protein [Jidongwangia harbinensis]MCA2213564.1 hypothetical protein [Jidongwangia harbinensis]
MATSDGWYLIGPLVAVMLIGIVGVVFWRLGLQWVERADDPLRELYGLAIFGEQEDYGLLCPAAVVDEPEVADDIRRLLADAGIRATRALRPDGQVAVLVFPEHIEEARRLVGDLPAL